MFTKIADRLKINQQALCNYIASYGIESSDMISGRCRKISDRLERLLVGKVGAGEFENGEVVAGYVKSADNIEVSGQMIGEILRKTGLKNYVRTEKTSLDVIQIKKG